MKHLVEQVLIDYYLTMAKYYRTRTWFINHKTAKLRKRNKELLAELEDLHRRAVGNG